MLSSYKSETSQQLHISSTFQNGEHLQPQWYLEEGGLHGQTRSQRHLSDSSYSLRTQVVPQVYLPGETFSVQNTSLWLSQSTSCVHNTPEAGGFNSQGFRYLSYIDDTLIMGSSPTETSENVQMAIQLLKSLGIIIN